MHILIIEDHQDVFENLERKIFERYPTSVIAIKNNCDAGFQYIKEQKTIKPISELVLDLAYNNLNKNSILKNGNQLLKALKESQIKINTIIYSSHQEMEYIHPVMNNYCPQGYVIKSSNSSEELLFALNRVNLGETYFSQKVHQQQLMRFKFASKIDEIDEQIIRYLPKVNTLKDWEGKILKDHVPMSYKSIKKRINLLCDRLEVENEKQLLLKLQRLAII